MTETATTATAAPRPAPARSGPQIARLYHRAFAAIVLVAWASLAVQVEVLIGSRGLLPAAEIHDPPLFGYPSLFRWIPPSDAVLVGGAWLGAALALAALCGLAPRILAGVQVILYLSYAVACRDFLGFQWDNLLLECALLATLLPRDRPAPLVHFLFRFLLFKLYFESGIAKWQSHLHDWQDGSAMTYYYETSPLPTLLAWFAHQAPAWWHHFESRAVLVLELIVPFGFFGPRRVRLVAATLVTGFQLVNLATANYGFFVYLALALHLFLLGDRAPLPPRPPASRARRIALAAFAALYLGLSLLEGAVAFFDSDESVARASHPLRQVTAPMRLVNTYHLFGHITRERIEPEFATSVDGETFTAQPMRWKAGPPDRAPPFVAPHQPRVDFLLWFYGLSYEQGTPRYVVNLVRHLCRDPQAVQPLFAAPLPKNPLAVEVRLLEYHFASPEERARGLWWHVTPRDKLGPAPCDQL